MLNFISKLSQLGIMMLILLSIISATLAMPYQFGSGDIAGPQNARRSLRRDLAPHHLYYGHEGLPRNDLSVPSTADQHYNPYYQQVQFSSKPLTYEPLPYNNLQQQPISYQYQNVISPPQIYATQEQNYPQPYGYEQDDQVKIVELTGEITEPSSIKVIGDHTLGGRADNAHQSQEQYVPENSQSPQDQLLIIPQQQQQQQHQYQPVIENNPIDYFKQQNMNFEHVDYSDKAQHFEPSQVPQQENISSEMPSRLDETIEYNNGGNQQEINQPPASQEVILPHEVPSTLNSAASMINYAPIPTQDLEYDEGCVDCENSNSLFQEGIKENFYQSENPANIMRSDEPIVQFRRFSQDPNVAYSYQNLNLNPYAGFSLNNLGKISEQRLPEMGFIFNPIVVRVQQPHLILKELRQFKFQLDHSPIMNALFSPETVPIPPPVPWPSNFNAQRYLPPAELFKSPNKHVKQEVQPWQQPTNQYDEPINQNDEQMKQEDEQSEPTSSRRAMTHKATNSIEQSIHDSIARNSALFGSAFQFKFPAMPDFDNLLKNELEKIKSQPNTGASLVQIGNGNTNINEVTQTDKKGKTVHHANMQYSDNNDHTDAKWASDLKIMNQIKETTTEPITTTDTNFLTTTVDSTDSPTTEIIVTSKMSNKSDETTLIPETTTLIPDTTTFHYQTTTFDQQTTTYDPQTTTDGAISTTLMNDLTTTDKYDTTTDISTTEEASTVETTTIELEDSIDEKIKGTLIG